MKTRMITRCVLPVLLGTAVTVLMVAHVSKSGVRHSLPGRVPTSPARNWSHLELDEGDPLFPVDCRAIVRGDEDEVAKAEILRVTKAFRARQRRLDEAELLNATRDCAAFRSDRRYLTEPLSREEEVFPLAYSVVAHHRADMLERLLRAIYAPQNLYCIHVDAKAPRAYLEAARGLAACFPNVFVAARLESVVYASWSRVQADLNCMQELVERSQQVPWRYLLNTCGMDFPIKTNLEMVQALRGLHGRNCLETRRIPYQAWRWEKHFNVTADGVHSTEIKKPPPPIATPVFAGNTYVVVTRAFVEHVLSDPATRALMRWEKDTYSPDEHMWATLQRMPSVPGSRPPHHKHDVDATVSIARLVRWAEKEGDVLKDAVYPRCRGEHVRGICINAVGDLAWVLQQRQLFVNKMDAAMDPVAVQCLEQHLRRKALRDASQAPSESIYKK